MSKVCDKMQGCLISNSNLELLGSACGIEGGRCGAGQGYPISSTHLLYSICIGSLLYLTAMGYYLLSACLSY